MNKNIVPFIIYGLLYDTAINLYKPFALKYLDRLGGTNLHITLYNSMPGVIATVVLFPGLFILSGVKKKKAVTALFIFIARITILAMAFIPVFPAEMRPIIFVGLIAFLNFPEAISQASMQSFLGSIFGGKVRALALSLRNQYGNLFILIITLISGLVISFIPRTEEQRMLCYQIFFVAAFIVGIAEVFFFLRLDEKHNPEYVEEETVRPKLSEVKLIFTDKKFLTYAVCTIIYYVSFHGGWAVSSIYQIKSLGANEIWLAVFAVISGISSVLSAGWWNKLITKQGNDKALVFACYLMGINSFFIGASPNLYWMVLQCMFNGFGAIGINISLLNGLLISTPTKNRLLYIGVYNTLQNLSLGLSPLLIQLVMDHSNVRIALFVVSAMRICAASLLLYVFIIRKRQKALV